MLIRSISELNRKAILNMKLSTLLQLEKTPKTLRLSDKLSTAIDMLSADIAGLDGILVIENKKYVGVITGREIITGLLISSPLKLIEQSVGDHMSTELFIINDDMTILQLIQKSQSIRRGFAISLNETPNSNRIITLRDLLHVFSKMEMVTSLTTLPLRNIIRVDEGEKIKTVLSTMLRNQIRHVFIGPGRNFVTERHILGCIDVENPNFMNTVVNRIPKITAITIDENESIQMACEKMIITNSSCLVTTNDKIITPWDLVMSIPIEKIHDYEKRLKINEKLSIIGELSARLNHDIMNPLSIIKSTTQILSTHPNITADQHEKLKRVDRACERITHQIRDVLNFVKTTPLNKEHVAISKIVRDSLERLSIPENIKIEIIENPVYVFCDHYKLEVVFANILSNAIISTQSKSETAQSNIIVEVKSQNKWVLIKVTDFGEGITKENMSKLFEPLFTTRQKGTGLGLVTCKNIVEQHEGTITVSSNKLKTVFTIKLPINV